MMKSANNKGDRKAIYRENIFTLSAKGLKFILYKKDLQNERKKMKSEKQSKIMNKQLQNNKSKVLI